MKVNIDIMIDAQRHWQNTVAAKEKIDSARKLISQVQAKLDEKIKKAAVEKKAVLLLKTEIKKKESDFAQIEAETAILNEKRKKITTDKELKALDRELQRKNEESDALENTLLETYDELSDLEQKYVQLEQSNVISTEDTRAHILELNKRIASEQEIIAVQTAKFDALYGTISPALQIRYRKLLETKNGIAIAEIHNHICTGCNFQVPTALTGEALHSEKILTCTNCGRYIFVRS